MQIPTNLLKTFNASLTELGAEMALIALREDGFGPFEPQAYRGFSPREIQAIVRALSYPEVKFNDDGGNGSTAPPKIRMRMTSPSHRSMLGIPLRYHQRICGALVIGRKDTSSFPDKDRRQIESAAEELESALAKSGLLASVPELTASPGASRVRSPDRHGAPAESGSPEDAGLVGIEQSTLEALMSELSMVIPYDRALLARYDSDSKLLMAIFSHTAGHFEWRQGRTFTLDGSAAGWVIRHKKPRLDRDLASTQGRFLDYKELFKDKFKTALVLPLRKGQNFIGTILLSSRTPDRYNLDMVRAAAAILEQLTRFLPAMAVPSSRAELQSAVADGDDALSGDLSIRVSDSFEAREMLLRQERQAAIRELTGFLEQEIQRTLTKTRLELEETLGDPTVAQTISEGSWQRVEQACRDLTRIEAILNEITDHAKPLDLHPRIIRVPEVINGALTVVADEIDQNLITVTRQFSDPLPPIKADESKLQQVFLSILKNALEAMSAGGHIRIAASPHRGARGRHEVSITIENDGAPIPTEHIGKIFEPGFTTKAVGTGLGLSSVKKIIEEHRGQISIASGPGQGTAVIIRLPAHAASRLLGRGRRRPRRRHGRP